MQLQDAAPQYIPCQQTVSLMCKVNFKPANAQSNKETHMILYVSMIFVTWTIRKQSALPSPGALRLECLLFAILVLPPWFVAMRLLLFLALHAESAAQKKACPETISIVGGT